jgi:hypothetical protein
MGILKKWSYEISALMPLLAIFPYTFKHGPQGSVQFIRLTCPVVGLQIFRLRNALQSSIIFRCHQEGRWIQSRRIEGRYCQWLIVAAPPANGLRAALTTCPAI